MQPSYTNRGMSRYEMVEQIAKGQGPQLSSERGGQFSTVFQNSQHDKQNNFDLDSRKQSQPAHQLNDYSSRGDIRSINHQSATNLGHGSKLAERNNHLHGVNNPNFSSGYQPNQGPTQAIGAQSDGKGNRGSSKQF